MNQKLTILTLATLLSATSLMAQRTLLFKLEHPSAPAPSYLFGTIHLQKEDVFGWNQRVYDAIDSCSHAAFELNLDMAISFQDPEFEELTTEWNIFFRKKLLPKLIKKVPADSLAARINRYVMPEVGAYMRGFYSDSSRISFVDKFLFDYAKQQGKNVLGIESAIEQMKALSSINKKKLLKGIMKFAQSSDWSVESAQLFSQQDGLIEAYEDHNLDLICNLVSDLTNSSENDFADFYHQMFTVRNHNMFDRTVDYAKTSSIFIGVGAGHLCGDEGLILLFRNAGFTVSPVNISEPIPVRNLSWKTIESEHFVVDVPEEADSVFRFEYDGESAATKIMTPQGEASFEINMYVYDYDDEMEEAKATTDEEYEDNYEDYEDNDVIYYDDTGTYPVPDRDVDDEGDFDDELTYSDDIQDVYDEVTDTMNEMFNDTYIVYDDKDADESNLDKKGIRHPKSNTEKYIEQVRSNIDFQAVVASMAVGIGWSVNPPSHDTIIACSNDSIDVMTKVSRMGTERSTIINSYYNGGEKEFILTIIGDRALLESGTLDRFFTTFCLKE